MADDIRVTPSSRMDQKEECGNENGSFRCTRALGHDGDHWHHPDPNRRGKVGWINQVDAPMPVPADLQEEWDTILWSQAQPGGNPSLRMERKRQLIKRIAELELALRTIRDWTEHSQWIGEQAIYDVAHEALATKEKM